MPILGVIDSGKSGHLSTNNYSSISTVTVGSGGASSITFSSIPSTYTHLQVRGIGRSTNAGSGVTQFYMQLNGDTGANYSNHILYGDGGSVGAIAASSTTGANWYFLTQASALANTFTSIIFDILDYTNTNKYKTIRGLNGSELNGAGGYVIFSSGLWQNTNAVTSITLPGNWSQYSQVALYGVR